MIRNLLSRRVIATTCAAAALALTAGCFNPGPIRDQKDLGRFATRYAAAWSGHDATRVAAFFAEGGSLKVNDNAPAVGRAAIAATVQSYVTAFPDLSVTVGELSLNGDQAVFHWTFAGTNTGPGGTGRRVAMSGYEEWTIGPDGLIARSLGHFDAAEYARQLQGGHGS